MSLDPASDADIILASLKDPDEFVRLFDRHVQIVGAFLASRVGISLAEDLTSETFLIAFSRMRSYDLGRPDARPWLLGIASNLMRHHWRSEARQLAAYSRTIGDQLAGDDQESINDRLDAVRSSARLAEGLRKLSRRELDPLLLLAWGNLTYEEISHALRLPIGTVKSRISRGRRKLREQWIRSGQ
jgi:RNA polymerase sigma factor (sigma-70 family)